MTEEDLHKRLAELQTEHADLDAAIQALIDKGGYNSLQIQRLKKRKLAIKDQITRIQDKLTPDIIA